MKYTILYIDDEPENLRVFKSVFRRDFNIITADSGAEGLEILNNNELHLIITDQRMPKMTGIEFLEKVYEKIPDKPPNRMILSGFSQPSDIEEAKKRFFLFSFVAKPWDAEDLKSKIDEAISNGLKAA